AANLRERIRRETGQSVDVFTFHGFAAKHVLRDGERVATELESDAAIDSLYKGPTSRKTVETAHGSRKLCPKYMVESAILNHESARFSITSEMNIIMSRLAESRLVPTWALFNRFIDVPQYRHVLVDEAQDCTRAEWDIVERTRGTPFFVGDGKQSIFDFRGAKGSMPFKSHSLTHSFRFGLAIASACNVVAAEFGGDPIEGCDRDSTVTSEIPDRTGKTTAYLARTHHDCAIIAASMGDAAVHVRRDPLDAFSHESDRIGSAFAAGKTVVSTVHGFKGHEADIVIVDESVFAATEDDRATVEDWRVLYVAMSRARDVLVLPPERIHAFI
ncbi:MAG: hypothetical protein E6Q97_35790, partial [Desulfurellales bacterium]